MNLYSLTFAISDLDQIQKKLSPVLKLQMNKPRPFLLIILIIMGFQTMATAQPTPNVQSGAYNTMLKALISSNAPETDVAHAWPERDSVSFLDARAKDEYKVSHIKGAVWVGYDNFDPTKVEDLPKDKPIIVYCSVGYRSGKIAERLISDGFTDVQNLYGGIFEWVNEGHPVYNSSGKTNHVHPYSALWGIWLKKGVKDYGNQ